MFLTEQHHINLLDNYIPIRDGFVDMYVSVCSELRALFAAVTGVVVGDISVVRTGWSDSLLTIGIVICDCWIVSVQDVWISAIEG